MPTHGTFVVEFSLAKGIIFIKIGLTNPRGVLYIFWVRGRAIGKGIDFHDFGIRNGIDFHDFGTRNGIRNFHNWYAENWYKVGYTFRKNWYKERVCF